MDKGYLKRGYLNFNEVEFPNEEIVKKHFVAVTECVQKIPCNPCVTSCPVKSIDMNGINGVPHINFDKCIGCGNCVAVCPGLAMFLVNIKNGKGRVSLPYEMLPMPEKGDKVKLLNRKGEDIGEGRVINVLIPDKKVRSAVVTVEFENPELIKIVRNIEVVK